MDEIKSIPRNQYLGMLADALGSVKDSTGVAGDFLLGDAPRTMDQWSYGFSPVRMGRTDQGLAGALYGMRVDPGIIDVAGVAGMAPGVAKGAAWAGKQGLGMINDAMMGGGNQALARALGGVSPRNVVPTNQIDEGLELWHGGYGPLDEVKGNTGVFDGIFASPRKEAANSHGAELFKTNIPEDKILTQQAIDYHVDHDDVMRALENASMKTGDDLDELYKFVVENENVFNHDVSDIQRIFGTSDFGDAGWEAQRLRGRMADNLGYKAVEMPDEHGTSYLVLPGNKFIKE